MSDPGLFSAEFARDPYPFYKTLRDDSPLFYHEGTKSWVVSRFEDVERVLKDQSFSSENYAWQIEPVHGRTIIQMEGKEHARHRGLLMPAFRGRDLRDKFVPVIERNARELIARFSASGEVDLVDAFTKWFPINVISEMLGLPRSDHRRIQVWYSTIVDFFSNVTGDPGVIARGLQTRQELAAYILPIIADRRKTPGDDLLSTLCAAEIDGAKLTDDEIRGFVSILLTAGGETTDKAVTSVFKNLLDHPQQLAAVRNDRDLVDNAFAETLRYSPPVHILSRVATKEVTLSGGVVPASGVVMCLLASANRDERRFAAAETFDIMRTDLDLERAFTGGANHTGFALGRHFCVGAILAKTEVQIATNLLLDAMDDIRLADGSPPEEGSFIRAPKSLKLRFSPAPADLPAA